MRSERLLQVWITLGSAYLAGTRLTRRERFSKCLSRGDRATFKSARFTSAIRHISRIAAIAARFVRAAWATVTRCQRHRIITS